MLTWAVVAGRRGRGGPEEGRGGAESTGVAGTEGGGHRGVTGVTGANWDFTTETLGQQLAASQTVVTKTGR